VGVLYILDESSIGLHQRAHFVVPIALLALREAVTRRAVTLSIGGIDALRL